MGQEHPHNAPSTRPTAAIHSVLCGKYKGTPHKHAVMFRMCIVPCRLGRHTIEIEEHSILRNLHKVLKVICFIYYPTKVRVLVPYLTLFIKHRVVNIRNYGINPIHSLFFKYVPLNKEEILTNFRKEPFTFF